MPALPTRDRVTGVPVRPFVWVAHESQWHQVFRVRQILPVAGVPTRMELALWIIGAVLLLDGIVIAWLRRQGKLPTLPAFIPLLSMGMGAVTIVAAFLASR